MLIEGKDSECPQTPSQLEIAFETLRDAAIRNLCIALEAAQYIESDCVPALVTNVSTKWFNVGTNET